MSISVLFRMTNHNVVESLEAFLEFERSNCHDGPIRHCFFLAPYPCKDPTTPMSPGHGWGTDCPCSSATLGR